jgi:glycine cleavage system H protein
MTMGVPAELRYTQEHEWISVEGSTATIGITDFATQALGDVVYVSLPAVGAALAAGEPCGEVESTKSVSDLYAPVDGEVLEVNEELNDDPGLINAEPYGLGWMFKIRVADWQAAEASLLSPAEYDALTKSAG